MVALAAVCGMAQAKILRVNNTTGSGAPYTTIDDALRQSLELRTACQEPNLKCLIDLTRIAQRLPQFHAVHASAFVISQSPIDNFLPMRSIENEWTTEIPLPVLEEFGLPKICLEDEVKFGIWQG